MSETPPVYDIISEPAPRQPRPIRHEISQRLAVSDANGNLTLHVGDFDGRRGWARKLNLTEHERYELHRLTAKEE